MKGILKLLTVLLTPIVSFIISALIPLLIFLLDWFIFSGDFSDGVSAGLFYGWLFSIPAYIPKAYDLLYILLCVPAEKLELNAKARKADLTLDEFIDTQVPKSIIEEIKNTKISVSKAKKLLDGHGPTKPYSRTYALILLKRYRKSTRNK